jgi:short-subunit dehydrogenase
MHLEGRTALITGASSGIGRATAIALARRGATVRLTGRDTAALEAVAKETRGSFLSADLADPDAADRVAEWAGPVDILVNNAGFGWLGSFTLMDRDRAEELVRVNLMAPVHLTAAIVPGMVERGLGHVVNIASIAGHVGVRHEAVYSATKAALIAFSESLRYELAGTGVGVSVVSPGLVRTSFFDREGHPIDRRFPRPVKPERVAAAIVGAVQRNRAEVFVPGWMTIPARIRGAMPRLFRRMAARFG